MGFILEGSPNKELLLKRLRVHAHVSGITLLQASELDPESKDDMALLWAVWYCIDLFPEQAKRLSGFQAAAQGRVRR